MRSQTPQTAGRGDVGLLHEPVQTLRTDSWQAQQRLLHTQGGNDLVDVGQRDEVVPGQVSAS